MFLCLFLFFLPPIFFFFVPFSFVLSHCFSLSFSLSLSFFFSLSLFLFLSSTLPFDLSLPNKFKSEAIDPYFYSFFTHVRYSTIFTHFLFLLLFLGKKLVFRDKSTSPTVEHDYGSVVGDQDVTFSPRIQHASFPSCDT